MKGWYGMKKAISLLLTAAMTASLAVVPAMADDATFKIGASGPLTGGAAAYGLGVVRGAEIAVDEINAAGGINGVQIEYSYEDDELDSEKSVSAYNTLKDWGMQVLVGPTTSGCSLAVSEKTMADNMFQISPSASGSTCVTYDNVFRVCFSDPNQGLKSAQYIANNGIASKVGVIYDSSDVYSSGIYQTFYTECAAQGIEIAAEGAFTADNKTDFSSQLQACKDAGVELIFLPIYYTEAGAILTQAASMGLDVKWFGCDGIDGLLGLENFNTDLAEGMMLLTPFAADATDDLTVSFVTTYEEKWGETPNQFAADAYDAVYAVKAAIEKSGATPDMSVSDLCEAIKGAMTEIEITGLTGTIHWTADGEPDKEPKAVAIESGAYVAMD